MTRLPLLVALLPFAALAQAASGVRCLDDDCETFVRTVSRAPLFSFASPTAFIGYKAYAGLPAADGCYAAASVTGTKGEALTFTRATTRFCSTDGTTNEATGVMCASGEVCIKTLNGKRGIDIFRAATNTVLRSEEFDNVAWTKISGGGPVAPTVDATDAVGCPVGGGVAEEVTFPLVDGTNKYSLLRQTVVGGAPPRRLSVWMKKKSGAGTKLWLNDGNGTSNTSVDCAPVTTGWKRCVVDSTNAAGNPNFDIGSSTYQSAQQNQDNGNMTVYLCGAMLESSASYVTPYVATAGAAVTRNAEAASFAGRGIGGPMSAAASVVLPTGWVSASANYATIISTYTSGADYWLLGKLGAGTTRGLEAYPSARRSQTASDLVTGRYWAYQTASVLGAGDSAASYATTSTSAVSNATLNVGNYAGTNYFLDGLISNVCLDPDPSRCR